MRKYVIIAVLVVIAVAIIISIKNNNELKFVTPSTDESSIPKGKLVTGSPLETFSGTITAVDTSCFSDGICSVSVDGKTIILVEGGRGFPPNPIVGKLIGVESIGDLETNIGKHANVYASVTPEGDYTLYGNDKYYVEVVDIQ